MKLTASLQSTIHGLRHTENSFNPIYDRAFQLAESINIDVAKKRIVRQQIFRSNQVADSLKDYYRMQFFS